MKTYFAVEPNINDPAVIEFARYIGNQSEIRMPARVPKVTPYVDNLKLVLVKREPLQHARPKMCWFNCKDYVESNTGSSIVFGWQIVQMHHENESIGVGAFHHAVIQENNSLVDITPYEVLDDDPVILFVPDSRVPFDYEGLRSPLSLFWSLKPRLRPFWTKDTECPNENRADGYGIGKPPTDEDPLLKAEEIPS